MDKYLPFVSIDQWTMIFTWVNLIILFLLLKKFLFKPVDKILRQRAEEIENEYKAAENTQKEADDLKAEYEMKLGGAKAEADEIIQSAVDNANRRKDNIVSEANEQAKHIIEKTQKQLETDKKRMVEEAKEDIASMAIDAAGKLISKKLDAAEDEQLISDIIDRM